MSKLKNSRLSGITVAAMGALMMCYGVYRGEVSVVFMKAVKICLECIGIG